jgi:hypothetical protein
MIKTARTRKNTTVANTPLAPTVEFRVGPDPRGPARCIHCRQPFKKGEAWKRMTSPPDPKLGAYSFGIHDRCSQALGMQAV